MQTLTDRKFNNQAIDWNRKINEAWIGFIKMIFEHKYVDKTFLNRIIIRKRKKLPLPTPLLCLVSFTDHLHHPNPPLPLRPAKIYVQGNFKLSQMMMKMIV